MILLELESVDISAIDKRNVNNVAYICEKRLGILKPYLTYLFVRYRNITNVPPYVPRNPTCRELASIHQPNDINFGLENKTFSE